MPLGGVTVQAATLSNLNNADTPDTAAVMLREVVVSSRPLSREISKTAATHSVGNADINAMGLTDITDAIHRLPGINLRDHGGAGSLKTISVRGLGTQHTAVNYDGASLSDVQCGQIDLARYSLDNVSNLTMVIGDNDDIFMPARSAASAATLLISSWKPSAFADTRWQLSAIVRTGAFGYISPFIKISKSNGHNFGFTFTGDYSHADNNYPYVIPNGDSPLHERRQNASMDNGHAEANMVWKPTVASSLTAKVYWYSSYQHLPGPAIMYNNTSRETLGECNMFGQVQYRTRLSRIFSVSALGKFNWSDTRYKDYGGEYPGGGLYNHYLQREAYVTGTLLANPVRGLQLSYAADYFYNDLRSNLRTHNRPHRNSILQALSAKYNVACIMLTARALLSIYEDTPGGGDKSRTATRLSPSAGIVIKPITSQDFYIRANYKNIFRMPSFNELYFDHYGSINLDPETTDQYNIGLSYSLPVAGPLTECTATVDGYYNHIRNKIVAVPYNMFVWTMTNMGKVEAAGADVTLSMTFAVSSRQNILLSGNYSYQKAVGRTSRDRLDWNKQLPYVPRHSGAFSLSWENPWVCAGMNSTACCERFATRDNLPSSRMPGYMVFGFNLYHTFRFKGLALEIRADLINAFDKRYEVVARYPMPGRSWQVSLKFNL